MSEVTGWFWREMQHLRRVFAHASRDVEQIFKRPAAKCLGTAQQRDILFGVQCRPAYSRAVSGHMAM